MKLRRRLAAALLLGALAGGSSAQEPDPLAARVSYLEKVQAQTGDVALLWLLADPYAQAGRKAEALAALERVAAARTDLQPAPGAFPALRGDARYEALSERLRREARVVRRARTAFTIDQPGLVPEGLAYDERTGRLFVGDMHTRRIFVVDPQGRTRVFAPPLALQPIGLRLDRARDRLWVATTDGFANAEPKRAELVALDLRTGRVVERRSHPEAKSFNDIAVAPNGDLFTTDSLGGAVYRAPAGAAAMERITPLGEFSYPNGLALTPDGRSLFVSQGVALRRVDVATGKIDRIPNPPGLVTMGTDGLYWSGDGLIAVQNGAVPGRVMRLKLSPAGDAVVGFEVLEGRHPHFDTPTTAALAPGRAYVIANAQLARLKPDGTLDASVPLKPVVILDLPL